MLTGIQVTATINIWQQFKALIPVGVRDVATITANNGNVTVRSNSGMVRLLRLKVVVTRSLTSGLWCIC
ncbi:hypothetical protein [Endozoicomonas sp. ONNA2]|uniref:hypothetical protein n=1 Tax=Endozoicomonas sp. ONNA2 TaxID=2828741 RepID=UPI0021483E39|nr:hypothetical protein [Endozoicomonas sp. ONNA2]